MLGCIEKAEELPLLGMIGTSGVACGGTNTTVLLSDKLLLGQVLCFAKAPEIPALLMEPLSSGLGEAIADRLH